MLNIVFEKHQWRSAWATEMSALGHQEGEVGANGVVTDTGPASDRFFRMWRVTAEWNPISAAEFLAANRGQVRVAVVLRR